MALRGYEEKDHTADLALRVWAEDFQNLLAQAAQGVYTLMGIVPASGSFGLHEMTILQENRETILVDFLTELLYLLEADGLILNDFSFEVDQDVISVRSSACKIISQERAIKAVTYHLLMVEETATGLTATITFDV